MKKTLGIVGGMGPEAGALLFDYILKFTRAKSDQEHLSVILMSLPDQIVDRTSYLQGRAEENPANQIVEIIKKLEYCDAKIIGIACNTSHTLEIFSEILEGLDKINSSVKLINMPEETFTALTIETNVSRVGVLSTNGTFQSGLYHKMLSAHGFDVVVPEEKFQSEIVHRLIYDSKFGLKANAGKVTEDALKLFDKGLAYLEKNGAEAVVLGCTELSVIKNMSSSNIILIDSLECLAKAMIREALAYNPFKKYDGFFLEA